MVGNPANPNRVLVTGATGGFGRLFARMLEERGHRLLLHGRDQARMDALLAELARPADHAAVLADLADEAGVAALIRASREHRVAGLVNNAGFGLWGRFPDVPAEGHADVLRVDLLAPVRLAHALLPAIREARGFIINVSSLAGVTPLPYLSTYAAAKAGLTFWSEALRVELAGAVRVVTLAPGPSPTGFRAVSGMPERTGDFFRQPAETVVRAALAALDRGGGMVVPGWRHRLLRLLQAVTPTPLALRLMERALRP